MSGQCALTDNVIFVADQNVLTQNVKKNAAKIGANNLRLLINLFDVFNMSNESSESNS